jgi:hypothetical protein
MDAADSSTMAGHMAEVVTAFYETISPIGTLTPGSLAEADRMTDLTGRSNVPWDSLPAETFQTIVAATSRAVVDHLHSTSHLLRDDIDFGPMVMARSTVEASGRVAWLLPPESETRRMLTVTIGAASGRTAAAST